MRRGAGGGRGVRVVLSRPALLRPRLPSGRAAHEPWRGERGSSGQLRRARGPRAAPGGVPRAGGRRAGSDGSGFPRRGRLVYRADEPGERRGGGGDRRASGERRGLVRLRGVRAGGGAPPPPRGGGGGGG